MDLNKVMLIGNVVRDPEMRTTPSGQTVASLSIATNLIWKDKAGQRQQKAEYHNIVAWRKLGEIVGQYLKKGSKVYIEGRLETRSWDDQNGIKKYRTEVIADNMIMLDKAGSQSRTRSDDSDSDKQETPPLTEKNTSEEEINIEDIPF